VDPAVLKRAFQHRSGRVISLGRVTLASVFLLAIWLDPSQPSQYAREAYIILAGYLSIASIYLALTWSDWWLEVRLSPWAHLMDVLLFGVMVFLTDGHTSPFFTFSVFIILSAAIKWGWRTTALTAATLIFFYLGGGFAAVQWGEVDFVLDRFLIRGTHLAVISLILIWFGINQRGAYLRNLPRIDVDNQNGQSGLPRDRIMRYAAGLTGAKAVFFLWWDEEEPWVRLAAWPGGSNTDERQGPEFFGNMVHPELQGHVFLFNGPKRRALLQSERGHRCLSLDEPPLDNNVTKRIGEGSGLVIPVESSSFNGLILLSGVPGLCADDISVGEHIRNEASGELQRLSAMGLSEEASASRTRLSLARDLHDSVVQLLAGTSFRLEGIRRAFENGRDPTTDIDGLQIELGKGQRELRSFIAQLRDWTARSTEIGARATLEDLLRRMERQWGIACVLERCPPDISIQPRLAHELQQLIREGISNAVRHGGADTVTISIDSGANGISLILADNGSGFPGSAVASGKELVETKTPSSLNERVHELGGSLVIYSSHTGTRITISLPREVVACSAS
jgi:signal transduction histidine kinase